jgi:long-chain acyl-CoA synthetase
MSEAKSINLFITGGTGFVGKAVLARLARTASIGKIYLLVRSRQKAEAQERVAQIIKNMFPPEQAEALAQRFVAVPGDLTQPGLGIAPAHLPALAADVHQILHLGASTDFGAALDVARRDNVEGTRLVLDLAKYLATHGHLRRFEYVSTAYVAGKGKGRISEDDLDLGQDFANHYERSKLEAEVLVRSYAKYFPIVVYRPSIVVGDAHSGYTPHFKVMYWPISLLAKNLVSVYTCNRRGRLDIVPVNYVADAIVALLQRDESTGQTYHLTAGSGNEVTIAKVLDGAYAYAGVKPRPFIPFWLFLLVRKSPFAKFFSGDFWYIADLAKPYYNYLQGVRFRLDNRKTQAQLAALGVAQASWDDFKEPLFKYCTESRWGKRVPKQEYLYYLPDPAAT